MVTVTDIKSLRDKTGAGMMDCKRALQEASGDMKKAERLLKELGKTSLANRSSKVTNAGRVFASIREKTAVLLELSCETDFVARNEKFIQLGNAITEYIFNERVQTVDDTIETMVQDIAGTIKENMHCRRFTLIERNDHEVFAAYVHGTEARIGAVVTIRSDKQELLTQQAVKDFAFDCALHAVAFRPLYLSRDLVDESYYKEQEEIFIQQVKRMNKPEKILQNIVQGKLRKHFSEICFLEQPFIKDEKHSVAEIAQNVGKSIQGSITIHNYLVYMAGEETTS